MVRTLTLFLGMLMLAGNCWGQRTVSVSGLVLGGEKQVPLESATVSCSVCGLWTLTDEAGRFTLTGMPVLQALSMYAEEHLVVPFGKSSRWSIRWVAHALLSIVSA